jgi:hypothetical protein
VQFPTSKQHEADMAFCLKILWKIIDIRIKHNDRNRVIVVQNIENVIKLLNFLPVVITGKIYSFSYNVLNVN